MKSGDKQLKTGMDQSLFESINHIDVQQDDRQVTPRSWVWRTWKRCKDCFLQTKCCCFCFGCGILLLAVMVALASKYGTSHHGKFPAEQCSSEWIGYRRKCYFISEEEKNWTSSQTFCAMKDSILVIFENQEEMLSLVKHLKIEDSWIGLRKNGENFYWENGIPLKMDLFQIQNHSDCAYLDTFTISTSACSLPRRCICLQPPKQ